MRHARLLLPAAAGALLAATALPAAAAPDGPQRLRGMEGRSFAVEVTLEDGTPLFDNCYEFRADGAWIDPQLPAPGTWAQHRIGASTTYTAAFGPVVQHGTVTPAGGRGTLQLEATTTVPTPNGSLTVISTGQEVASCD